MADSEPNDGKGLGIGEVTDDATGEGDGCDRCGCPDEEVCCPRFWHDSGVPGIWPLSWVFDPHNKWLNDNACARTFGNFGFHFFDKERKAFMGTALAVTVVAIVITGFGCFALSSDENTLRVTAWGIASHRYESSDGSGILGQVAYVGLRKFVVHTCADASPSSVYAWKDCEVKSTFWSEAGCVGNATDYYGLPCDEVDACAEASINSQFGAFLTCVTLIFAMNGCLARIRKRADTNFQKFLGCVPDLIGCVTQLQALALFAASCHQNMPDRDANGNKLTYSIGAGFWAYIFCWMAAVVRTAVHCVTPVPGGGSGCSFIDPEALLRAAMGRLDDAEEGFGMLATSAKKTMRQGWASKNDADNIPTKDTVELIDGRSRSKDDTGSKF